MINRKCNCKNEVSSRKLAVLKKASLAKTFVYPSMMWLWTTIDTKERTNALKLHLTGTEFI